MAHNDDKIHIANTEDLDYLVRNFKSGDPMAFAFVFDSDELYTQFFEAVGIDVDAFQEKYFFYDSSRNIHISESESGCVWISTMGLVAKSKITENKYVNACYGQKIVLAELLDKAIAICSDERVYNIDSYLYSEIEQLTLTLFHNSLFYFETIAKAYLSICGEPVPFTHKLEDLLTLVKQTMFKKQHNNTLFHEHVIPMLEEIVRHINTIPGKFKEEYVKYDDNPQDITVILFEPGHLSNMKNMVEFSHDIIVDMYDNPEECMFLRPGLYQRLLQKCETEEDRNHIEATFGFLLSEK